MIKQNCVFTVQQFCFVCTRILSKAQQNCRSNVILKFRTVASTERQFCFSGRTLAKEKVEITKTPFKFSIVVNGKSQKHLLSFRISITPVTLQSTEICFAISPHSWMKLTTTPLKFHLITITPDNFTKTPFVAGSADAAQQLGARYGPLKIMNQGMIPWRCNWWFHQKTANDLQTGRRISVVPLSL